MSFVYDEFEAMRFLYSDQELAANALEVISEIHGKEFIQEKVKCTGEAVQASEVKEQVRIIEVPTIDLDMIMSRLNFMLNQSAELMSEANKESLREILSEVKYAKKRQN